MPDLRIALVGPESSGKTTLALQLQSWLTEVGFSVGLVVEQGRLLAEALGSGHVWGWREQQVTSLMHQAAEAQTSLLLDQRQGATALIADGAAVTPLVWHMCAVRNRHGYDRGRPAITEELLEAVEKACYDVVLLTRPDIAWVPDGIRDDPDGREDAFAIYHTLYPDAVVISGEDRLRQAKAAIQDE